MMMMMMLSSSDILLQPPKLNIITFLNAPRRRRRRTWRLNSNSHLVIRRCSINQLSSSSSSDNLFYSLISQLDLVSPPTAALGFTTALATAAILYNSTLTTTNDNHDEIIGYWSLFTSPTPFNRFIKLRCPSLLLPPPPHFEQLEEEHDSNEKLVEEDGGHVVNFDTGPIQQINHHHHHVLLLGNNNQVSYQRVCVNTDDGGVVSLDWPSHLELNNKEHALDTTVFIVPGTTDGSMDQSVRSFVYECLNRGCFPVVMNPRGCARSPLTTPRLFTAADSDDICTAVQFINRARPWTTLMAVGFGYGANMLTKYLAEVGEETPLTAATCLDNPFDLKQAPNHQNLTDGLIDMLQSNKELFQGRSKGFDVEKALQAKSLKEFEEAISMVSYGFDSIEEFYVSSSTKDVVGNVKIPLLFIQNNAVSTFSISRSSIAENPFTGLLICTFRSDDKSITGTFDVSWCQHLVIEWLTAVEVGLLKGRHPLLEDTDVTINPSKHIKLMATKASHASSRSNNLRNLHRLDAFDGNNSFSSKQMVKIRNDYAYSSSGKAIDTNGTVTQTNLVDSEVGKEGDVAIVDDERGKVLQATEVVMNMLDGRMPEALSEEQKQKVLDAVGRGETVMNALQEAVPEDVRGKLTSSVTAILQNQKKALNGISSNSHVPDVISTLNTKMQERSGISNQEKEPSSSELNKGDTSLIEESNNLPSKNDASEPEAHKPEDSSQLKPTSHDELESDNQTADTSKEKPAESSHLHESDSSAISNISSKGKKSGSSEEHISEQVKLGHEGETKMEKDSQQKEEKDTQSSTYQKNISTPMTEESSSPPPESQVVAKEDGENQKKEESSAQPEAHKPEDSSQLKPTSHDELGSDNQTADTSKEKPAESSHLHESDSSAISNISSKGEKSGSSEEHISEQVKLGHEGETKMEKDSQQKEEKDTQSSTYQKKISTPMTEESSSPPPESQVVAKEDGENQKKEESSAQPVPSNDNSTSPSFSVSHALDALTGMDDSTQVAVNSVFSVIEDVITQLEGSSDESTIGDKDKDKVKDTESEPDLQHKGDGKSNMATEPKEMVNQQNMSISKLSTEKKDEAKVSDKNQDDICHSVTKLPSRSSLYDSHIQSRLHSNMKNDKLLNSDAATGLILDYIPEEGQWKLLEKSGNGRINVDDATYHESIDVNVESPLPSDVECNNDIIEPAYVILDGEDDDDPVGEHKKIGEIKEELEIGDVESVVLMQLVKENILHSLKVEVCRRQATDMEDIAPILKKELEHVANTISLAVVCDKQHIISWDGEELVGLDNLQDEHILDAISSAFQGTRYMKEVIPVGIVVGSSLASLRKKFNFDAEDSIESTEVVRDQISGFQKRYRLQADRMVADDKLNQDNNFCSEDDGYEEEDVSNSLRNDTVMAGAVTAALGASALLVRQQGSYSDGLESSTTSSMPFNQKENHGKLEEETSKSSDFNIVTSLAEKAMSVAAPVVPTKEGGEVDQERIVALLADWGQKGGILRLIGKVALLWGGIRGAMSLTGKLISFLRLAERPLFQRILGFISMVLVLWTPVVVPLLPTLVQNWAAHNSSNMAELVCIIGLYSSIMILVVLWGKRIRGYEDPLERYGLELRSARQIRNFLCGLVGGVMLVLLIQYTNVLLGFVSLSWPTIPSSTDTVTLLKLSGQVLRFVGQGLVTTIAVALVEEVLFRSWLPEEIAVDLGYNRGIILSGLAFSLSQWSLKAIPGLWLLSLGLAGVRQICQGSLSLPIGLRAGIMASSFILKEGGFLIYQPTYPLWLSGGDAFQPFNSIVGLAVAILWAAILYPRKPQNEDTLKGDIK